MSDIRLRALSFAALSLAVFFLPAGSAAGILWWLFFAALPVRRRLSAMFSALLIAALPTLVLVLSGAPGAFFYGAKTFVLLLLAFTFGQQYAAGEFQSLFVWLLGERTGFDIGMACENLVFQTSLISDDARGFLLSLRQKGRRLTPAALPSFASGVVVLALRRVELSAKLLARRGYVSGGTFVPEFSADRREVLQTAGAFFAVVLVLLLQGSSISMGTISLY